MILNLRSPFQAYFLRHFFSIWIFFHENLQITGLQGKEEGFSLTPHYHFQNPKNSKFHDKTNKKSNWQNEYETKGVPNEHKRNQENQWSMEDVKLHYRIYRKINGLEVDCYVLLFWKVKRPFNLSHVTKVSAVHRHLQEVTIEVFSLGRLYIDFLILLTENILTDFEDDDLIYCTSKFCYCYGNFQNTKAATVGVSRTWIKISQISWKNTYATVSFSIKLQALGLQLYFKKGLRHRYFPLNFVKLLKTPFWKATVSDKKHLSSKKLFWRCLKNVQEHTCIRLQFLNDKFCGLFKWGSMPVSGLSGLICLSGGYF